MTDIPDEAELPEPTKYVTEQPVADEVNGQDDDR